MRILAAYYHGRIKYQNQRDSDATGDTEAGEKDKSFSTEKDKTASSEKDKTSSDTKNDSESKEGEK